MIKVVAYCRVSTDHEEQANSFQSQQHFFRDYIQHHPNWELYDIYADEGITGTSTRKRIQFNRMMEDAYLKRFQLIITKEVSRFSRNILDTISYTRELKSLGIGVIFMSDGFNTLEPDAELRLSIMGSIAQEESRKTSDRVKWGQARQMEKGVVFGRSLLGFDLVNGNLSINQEGAQVVKLIFYKYGVEKKGTTVISKELREAGYRTHTGNTMWSESTIMKILKNEKYVGDLVQKKTITPDYLTHIKQYNHGEEPFIIIKEHHEGIVSRELWDLVQNEIVKRNRRNRSDDGHSNRYIFSGKIICGECGGRFISRTKTRADGSFYRRWRCLKASREGSMHTNHQGNIIGCDIGKLIRDELATEITKFVLQHLDMNYQRVVNSVISLIVNASDLREEGRDNVTALLRQIQKIRDKKACAIDAYLSDLLSVDEFQEIKTKYDRELASTKNKMTTLNTNDNQGMRTQEIKNAIESIVNCSYISEAYFKTLIEALYVYKDGVVEVKLNHLPTIWRFRLL